MQLKRMDFRGVGATCAEDVRPNNAATINNNRFRTRLIIVVTCRNQAFTLKTRTNKQGTVAATRSRLAIDPTSIS